MRSLTQFKEPGTTSPTDDTRAETYRTEEQHKQRLGSGRETGIFKKLKFGSSNCLK